MSATANDVTTKDLRVFAITSLVFASLAAFLLSRGGHTTAALILGGIFGAVGLVGLLSPELVRPVYRLLSAITAPIGAVVSAVLIGVIYYLLVTPTGLLMRLAGYDPMKRAPDRAAATYWTKRDGPRPAADYFRQY